jgi:hypothetical protein
MDFEIIGEIAAVETIAVGTGIRNLRRLQKRYGRGALAQVQRICEDSLAERGHRACRNPLVRVSRHRQARIQGQTLLVTGESHG